MRVILLGPPGAGKGTQADFIQKEFNIPKISTGDILRRAAAKDDEFGLKIKRIIESGELVSDEIIIEILKRRIAQDDCKNGFLLDGFPRTEKQAEALRDAGIRIDYVLVLQVADDKIVDRLSGRLVDPLTQNTYHKDDLPAGIKIETLVHRADDDPEKVRKRLQIYHADTEPLVKWYENEMAQNHGTFEIIDAADDVETVHQTIGNILKPKKQIARS